MNNKAIFRSALILHTLIAGTAGIYFYSLPASASTLWPWTLPPLAARFMGSLLMGGALCSALTALSKPQSCAAGIAFIGIGDGLIGLTGVFYAAESGLDAKLAVWLVVFLGGALILGGLAIWNMRPLGAEDGSVPIPRLMRQYFALHLFVVALVGATMFLLPVQAQPLWPWMMSVVNVRMIGAFFVGAAFYSFWCLRQTHWETIQPTMALYAVFATTALIASFIHFSLFNPARLVTWAFVVLYAFVGLGGWYFLWRMRPHANLTT